MVTKKISSTILAATLTLSLTTTSTQVLANGTNNANPSIELYSSDVYQSYGQQIESESIKYGLLEVRNTSLETNVIDLTYYTHYSLNQKSALKNGKFNITLDEALIPYVDHVRVNTKKDTWIQAERLNNHTYTVSHKDVLRTGLIGVNQQFDIQVVLKNNITDLAQERYTFDIALLNSKDEAFKSTMDGTLLKQNAAYEKIQKSNKVTASGYTVKSNHSNSNEIVLNYMMHYKLNDASNKYGQFKFELDPKLLPYLEDVLVKTRDGKFKSVKIDSNGKFAYGAKSLVSHSNIGVRQNFEVKLLLKEQNKDLPAGFYEFTAYQADVKTNSTLENTYNATYFTR